MLKKAFSFSALFSLLLAAGPVKYIAHRGDYVDAPEGTAAAYRFAVERHYDIMKMDVQKTKDGLAFARSPMTSEIAYSQK